MTSVGEAVYLAVDIFSVVLLVRFLSVHGKA